MKLKELYAISETPIFLFDKSISVYHFPFEDYYQMFMEREIESFKAEHWQDGFGVVLVAELKEGD